MVKQSKHTQHNSLHEKQKQQQQQQQIEEEKMTNLLMTEFHMALMNGQFDLIKHALSPAKKYLHLDWLWLEIFHQTLSVVCDDESMMREILIAMQ